MNGPFGNDTGHGQIIDLGNGVFKCERCGKRATAKTKFKMTSCKEDETFK